MIYFKNNAGEVFAYASKDERDQYGASDLVAMTGDEVTLHLNPVEAPMTLEQVQAARLSAYRAESDNLKLQADFDALQAGTQPDYSAWIASVEAIKQRYPLPTA